MEFSRKFNSKIKWIINAEENQKSPFRKTFDKKVEQKSLQKYDKSLPN